MIQNILEVDRERQVIALRPFAAAKTTASTLAATTGFAATTGTAKAPEAAAATGGTSATASSASCAATCRTVAASAVTLPLVLSGGAALATESESLTDAQIRNDRAGALAIVARNDLFARNWIRIKSAELGDDDTGLT